MIDPVPEELMEKQPIGNGNTVCQILRDIYHLTDNEVIRYKLRVATAMTKRMAGKLKYYKDIGAK